ncbi:MAG TPA: hypothetical protein DCP28_21500 [Cytophagales bacterium]|nr:hypothetical protein [Cytophagales bacterium]
MKKSISNFEQFALSNTENLNSILGGIGSGPMPGSGHTGGENPKHGSGGTTTSTGGGTSGGGTGTGEPTSGGTQDNKDLAPIS